MYIIQYHPKIITNPQFLPFMVLKDDENNKNEDNNKDRVKIGIQT